MTWVKLGEERVNTKHVVRYFATPKNSVMVRVVTATVDREYHDHDGALLRALDGACFPGPTRAQQEGIDYFVGERLEPMPYGRVDEDGIHIDGWQVR